MGFFLHDQNRNSRLRLCTLCVLTIFLKYRFSFTIVPWLSLGGPGCLLRLWSQDFGYERTWTVVQGDSTSAVKTFKRSTVVEMGENNWNLLLHTDYSLSEPLILTAIYPNMSSTLNCFFEIQNNLMYTSHWTFNSMNNLSSYFGLIDARISASEKV